jgi:cell division protein FtsW (lipid II flippase)
MANVSNIQSKALQWHMQRQLKFPPLLTLLTGIFAVLAWNSYVYPPVGPTVQMFRAAIPFWAAFTTCFFIVSRQPRRTLKTVGWTGLVFSVFALMLTIAELSRH